MLDSEYIKSLPSLRNLLPKGGRKAIFDLLDGKYSRSYIHKVLHGTRFNLEIIEAAISICEKEASLRSTIENRLNTLTSKT